tara:strand:- start:1006 stop:1491 length:486 start_codon:yes stop_codon:yes gene_type:complete
MRAKTKYKIKLIVYDFDGVMTDNKVYVDQNGKEMVQVNRADGLGISEINKLGIKQIIISTEKNPVVSKRAQKLDLIYFQGVKDKKHTLINFCKKNKIDLNNVAYIGNDINDLEVMEIVKYTFCPSDSHNSIKKISRYTLKSRGGEGVIRELFDLLTNTKGD